MFTEAEAEQDIQLDNEPKMIPVIVSIYFVFIKTFDLPHCIPWQKKIPAFIKTPVLHIHFGCKKPEDFDSDTNYFYMLRRYDMPIDIYDCNDDCFAEMPNRVLFGTARGSMIYNIKHYLEKIYQPMVNVQYRVPRIDSATSSTSSALDESVPKKASEKDDGEEVKKTKTTTCLMDFSRPSDFRLIAVKAKKTG